MHEDLAERNILLVRQSGAIRVVLIDFSCSWVNVFPEVMEEHEWGGFLSDLESNMVHSSYFQTDKIRSPAFSRMSSLRALKTYIKLDIKAIGPRAPNRKGLVTGAGTKF